MWLVFYVNCVDIIAQVYLTPLSRFLFLDMLNLKLRIIIILPTDQLEKVLPTTCTTEN